MGSIQKYRGGPGALGGCGSWSGFFYGGVRGARSVFVGWGCSCRRKRRMRGVKIAGKGKTARRPSGARSFRTPRLALMFSASSSSGSTDEGARIRNHGIVHDTAAERGSAAGAGVGVGGKRREARDRRGAAGRCWGGCKSARYGLCRTRAQRAGRAANGAHRHRTRRGGALGETGAGMQRSGLAGGTPCA